MATYIPGIETYVPQVEAFTPDYKFLENIMSTRQDRYTNNYNQLNELYGKVVYADLSREDNQNIRDQYANDLTPKIEQVSGLDLSLQENVNAAKGLFKPFYEDKALVRDLMFTKEYRKQTRYMDSLKNSPNEKTRKKYWDVGAKWMNYQMEDFKSAERDSTLSMGQPEYVDNVDLVNRGIEALKEYGMSVERTTPQGDWLITTKNGQQLTRQLVGYKDVTDEKTGETVQEPIYANPAYDFLEQTLLEDPAVTKAYHTKAKVDMRDFAKANADKYGSYEEAQKFWANDVLKKFRGQEEEKLVTMESQLKGIETSVQNWEQYKKDKGIVPGTEEEDAMLKRIFERDILKETFEKKQENLKDKSAPVSTTDLLLNKAYGAQMAFEMGTDMNKAAIAYSMIDYKETMEANPFKVDYYKHQYNVAEINLRHSNKMQQIQEQAFWDTQKAKSEGGNGVDITGGTSGPEVVLSEHGTEQDLENWITQTATSQKEAITDINSSTVDHLEFSYNNIQAIEESMRGDGPIGTISYKAAKFDTEGNFTGEYENVNKTFFEAKQDLMKFENKGERERLSGIVEDIAIGTTPATTTGNADLPNNFTLIQDPGKQKQFMMQREVLKLKKMQFADAMAKTNAVMAEAYSLLANKKPRESGGDRNRNTLEENYGMPSLVMNEDMYNLILEGNQYNNVKGNFDLATTDPTKLKQLSKDDYIDMFVRMVGSDKVRNELDSLDLRGWRPIMGAQDEADVPMLTQKKKLNVNPIAKLWRNIRYGAGGHKPTLLGNFWDYNETSGLLGGNYMDTAALTALAPYTAGTSLVAAALNTIPVKGVMPGSNKWSFDEEGARKYAGEYYDKQVELISEEISRPGSNISRPADFNYLYKGSNYLGGGADATQWHGYRFQYDHLNNGSKQAQTTINEVRNLANIMNGHPDNFVSLLGDQGDLAPWDQVGMDGISQGKWNKKLRKGNFEDNAEMQQSERIMRQVFNDMSRSDKTKTAPGYSMTYRQYVNSDGEDWGSYTFTFDEDYSEKLKKMLGDPKKDEAAKEFHDTNALTVYFKRSADNSAYKASNQQFSPIQANMDTTGEPYAESWPGVGNYTFYKNGDGGYSARVQPVIFDSKTGNRVLDEPFIIGVDTGTTSFEALSLELQAYLYDLARQNNNGQDAYKYNFFQWQERKEFDQQQAQR